MKSLRKSGRAAFIPYITAGDPTLAATRLFLRALESARADIVELGVPFSDPMADGPVNQRSAQRALKNGATLGRILEFAGHYRRGGGKVPIVLFTYFNPLLRFGLKAFAKKAEENGIDGVLTVDLPPEEAGEYRRRLDERGIAAIFLASPTTSAARMELIGRASTGFVYYVSRLGVTGERAKLPAALAAGLKRLRGKVRKPVAVGFGISTPEQVRAAARHADGVVVGSALVKLTEGRSPARAARLIRAAASAMVRALRGLRRTICL
ncbi:MAG: tryptophan synthase subunit alpha [Elusimicrobia bacterium]|nr:tryptophan synthase subunit alpha [Elusimicrobiota bacterium]